MTIGFQDLSGSTDKESNTDLRFILSNINNEEKKIALLRNPDCLGQHVGVEYLGLYAKNELIDASRTYFTSHNNVLEGGHVEMDVRKQEGQYNFTYNAMTNFVTVYVLPQFTLYLGISWSNIGCQKRKLLALEGEDRMFSYIPADDYAPIFVFTNSWRSKTFQLLQSETL
ncbi:hypothetical protein INT47_012750 [Mucor saturninus]|uniref:Uncharacterized protein n=1 Tax=Mucor saturninus TaxID=64648 RepID=A0A8H7UPZ3_9FUNG|nr:hypothetical protein INT47_012750 [Mucor saturninus]